MVVQNQKNKRKEEKKMTKTQILKAKVREELNKKGFIIDSSYEGDFKTWIGVYARPKEKPTYLDPKDNDEVAEQENYNINGMKQDFSEWFEWEVEGLQII
ncbi:hypothetical protein [Enterococcus faecium]|uniref:hypothetical protein n=1 Tax=Enterococcus TaxID=1350 RepID=UPI0018832214|nr:hypothetical protein [Enterococcus faecium]